MTLKVFIGKISSRLELTTKDYELTQILERFKRNHTVFDYMNRKKIVDGLGNVRMGPPPIKATYYTEYNGSVYLPTPSMRRLLSTLNGSGYQIDVFDPTLELDDDATVDISFKKPITLYPVQKEAKDKLIKYPDAAKLLGLNPGEGKMLANYTQVPTPRGFTSHGDLRVGDKVIGSDGNPTEVTAAYPHPNETLYRVNFSDGTYLDAGGPHLWHVADCTKTPYIGSAIKEYALDTLTTDEILKEDFIAPNSDVKYKYAIPANQGWMGGSMRKLPHNPYSVGSYIVAYEKQVGSRHSFIDISIHKVMDDLDSEAGLMIPQAYLRANRTDRERLYDGIITARTYNSILLVTTSKRLCNDFLQLGRSLGKHLIVRASTKGYVTKTNPKGDFLYRVFEDVETIGKAIVSIDKLPDKIDASCITVFANDNLYLAGKHYTTTHNTFTSMVLAVERGYRFMVFAKSGDIQQWKEETEEMLNADIVSISGTSKLIKLLEEAKEGKRPDVVLISLQTYRSYVKRWMSGDDRVTVKPYELADVLKLGTVISDECESKDTEILTEKGWEYFKDLEKGVKVAQWHQESRGIDFVYPEEYIKKWYTGNLVSLKSKYLDILCTPNHQQPFTSYSPKTKTYSNRKTYIDDVSLHSNVWLPVSGINKVDTEFTYWHRFLIMVQADGCMQHKRIYCSFSKQRKIDRYIEITKELNYEVKECKGRPGVRRFGCYHNGATKLFEDNIDITKVGETFASKFILELMEWDGYTGGDSLYYSTTEPKNADFIQTLAALSGWKCYRAVQEDARGEQYKDVHRLTFLQNTHIRSQAVVKSYVPYDDYVYCVRVPSGNIVIRRNNKVAVTGNCHKEMSALWLLMSLTNVDMLLGLSGTMSTDGSRDRLAQNDMFPYNSRFIQRNTTPYITLVNYVYGVNQPKYLVYTVRGRTSYSHMAYEKWILQSPMRTSIYVNMIGDIMEEWYFNRKRDGDRCLVFVVLIKMAEAVLKHFNVRFSHKYNGINYINYTGSVKKEELVNMDVIVSTLGKAGTAIDIRGLVTLINTVAVSKVETGKQNIQRLRKPKGVVVDRYLKGYMDDAERVAIQLHNADIPSHSAYSRNRARLITPLLTSTENRMSDVRL